MITNKQINALYEIIDSIRYGYGWVAESMMQIYTDEAGIDWEEVEEYLDTFYDYYKIGGEKVWDINSLGKEEIAKKSEEM